MERRRSPFLRTLVILIVIAGVGYFTRATWLPVVAAPLIRDEGPAHADMIVVLAGDFTGRRIMKASEFIREGYSKTALISGPEGFFGGHESDYSIPYAVRQGARSDWFISFPNTARSTQEEAGAVVPELQRRRVKSALIVTTDFHTGRAGRIFRKAAQGTGITIRVAAAPDPFFHEQNWWLSREAQETVFLEWCKTVATALGI